MSDRQEINGKNNGGLDYTGVAFNANPFMNVVFNKNRKIVHCNPKAMQFLGAKSVEEANSNFFKLFSPNLPGLKSILELFTQSFAEAEISGRAIFEYSMTTNGVTEYVHNIVNRVSFGDDYVFAVSGYDLTELRSAEARLTAQDTYLTALNMIGETLLSADYNGFYESLNMVSEIVGMTFDAARVSICRISPGDSSPDCSSLSSWYKGATPDSAAPDEECTHLPPGWLEILSGGNPIRMPMSGVAGDEAALMRSHGIQYVALIPIVIKNELWGCIRLLYTDANQVFTISGSNALSGIARMLASGIMRNDSTGRLMNSISTNRAILDFNPFNCIIFDRDTNIIHYNQSTRDFLNWDDDTDTKAELARVLKTMVPEIQAGGRRAVPFLERLNLAFTTGYGEFETMFIVNEKRLHYNIIMKKVIFQEQDAVIVYMFDLTEEKGVQFALKYHDNLLAALGSVANLLLSADSKDLNHTMYNAVELIGRTAYTDRAYVWKNTQGEDGRLYTSQLYEWSPEVAPQQGNELAVNIAFDDVVPDWRDTLLKGISKNIIVKNATPEEQAQLAPQGIVSLLLVPIFLQDKFWGFIGFDDCHNERIFTSIEENFLRICGFMTMVINDTLQNEVAMNLLAEREAALVSAQIKTNFLANMSHEIRTPMNAILGMTELIMHENVSGTVMAHATDIRNACRGLLTIINDILDISKIESGKLEIVPIRYNISSMLMDVINIIKMRADKKAISFVVNIDTNIPSELLGDELRIRQILINILNNAIKFTQRGQITLTVSHQFKNDACQLEFSVKDTGVGIKQEDMDKVFVLFQQVDTKKNREIEGTGLGLSISKQLAEMMDGSIEMESEYGVGSTFTVSIRQEIVNNQPVAALKNPSRNSVIVYENRAEYLESITYALDSLGCRYEICTNRSEMYKSLDEFECDYIFISSLYVRGVQSVAARKQPNAVIATLNGDGTTYLDSNMIYISMPIHCLQLANIFNDEHYTKMDNTHTSNIVAPDARVLVVDDNDVNLKVAVGLLSIYKIKADSASGGLRAITMVKDNDYDLIFMDHMMPEMDGIDTTVAIRALGSKYKLLPIIALTANAIGGVKEMFRAEGLDDFLAKPIEMTKLDAILKKWLPKAKQQERAEEIVYVEAFFEIPGVNTRKGVQHSGGALEDYHEILAIYAFDSEKRLAEMMKYYKEDDIKSLTICVHAVKSASANIGADNVSDMAAELESACKLGDISYVDTNLQPFLDALVTLLVNLRNYLKGVQREDQERNRPADNDLLKRSLNEIETHMNNLDVDAVENLLNELNAYRWDSATFEWLNKMKSSISIFDYDGIAEAAEGLRATIGAE